VDLHWQYFLKRDWEQMYQLESPPVKNDVDLKSYSMYYHNGGESIGVELKVAQEKISDNRALIEVVVLFKDKATDKMVRSSNTDKWIKIDNVWYHQFYDPILYNKFKD
jgi:uncharacterized protein YchJ